MNHTSGKQLFSLISLFQKCSDETKKSVRQFFGATKQKQKKSESEEELKPVFRAGAHKKMVHKRRMNAEKSMTEPEKVVSNAGNQF